MNEIHVNRLMHDIMRWTIKSKQLVTHIGRDFTQFLVIFLIRYNELQFLTSSGAEFHSLIASPMHDLDCNVKDPISIGLFYVIALVLIVSLLA